MDLSGLIWFFLFGSVMQDLDVDEFPPFQKLYLGGEMMRVGEAKRVVLDSLAKARDSLQVSDPDRKALDGIFTDLRRFTAQKWRYPDLDDTKVAVQEFINFTEAWQQRHVQALEDVEAMKSRHSTEDEKVALQAAVFVLQDFINDLQALIDRAYEVERGEPIKATGPVFDIFRQLAKGNTSGDNTIEFHKLMDSHPLTVRSKKAHS